MFLKRAEKSLENSVLNRYPIFEPTQTEKVYFFINQDGSHVLQKNGNAKCTILDDQELQDFLEKNKLQLIS